MGIKHYFIESIAPPNKFNSRASTSYKSRERIFIQSYISGSLTGVYNTNLLSFHWGFAFETSTPLTCDGILGMGHQYIPKYGYEKSMSLMEQLYLLIILSKRYFQSRDNKAIKNSKVFIGGYHEDFNEISKARIYSCKLANSLHWVLTMSHIVIGNSSILYSILAQIELAPLSLIEPFIDLFPPSCKQKCSADYCTLMCIDINTLPDIWFVFNGLSYKLSKSRLFGIASTSAFISSILFKKSNTI